MRTILLITMLLLMPSPFASGQGKEDSTRRQKWAESLLERYATESDEATKKRDLILLDRLMDDGFIFINFNGGTMNKQQAMAQAGSQPTFEELEDRRESLRVFADTVVVTGTRRARLNLNGREITGEFRYTNVFVIRGEKLRLVVSHLTRISPRLPGPGPR